MIMRMILQLLLFVSLAAASDAVDLWSGASGQFRIPVLTRSTAGTLLAFCEDRRHSLGDSGDINLVVRRSFDSGRSWTPESVVWDEGSNTVADCAAVVNRKDGTIWLLCSWNLGSDEESTILSGTSRDTRRMFSLSSTNDGATWSQPKEITGSVKQPDWTWVAAGPGVGVQLEHGPAKGRLLIPCYHGVTNSEAYHSHVIYSDDDGASWTIGGVLQGIMTTEGQLLERIDGTVLLNMRGQEGVKQRVVSQSQDGGLTWSTSVYEPSLPDPIVQGSLARYIAPPRYRAPRAIFANPASECCRERLTVRLSNDDATSWAGSVVVHQGPSGYSCLLALDEGEWAILYENGPLYFDEKITFARMSLRDFDPTAVALDPAHLEIVAPNLTIVEPGIPYSKVLEAAGGTPPYQWSLVGSADSKATSFQISPEGMLSGLAAARSAIEIVVGVRDAVGESVTRHLQILTHEPDSWLQVGPWRGLGQVGEQLPLRIVPSTPGFYGIEWSPNLLQWEKLTRLETAESSWIEFNDSPGVDANRFYRAVRQ